VVGRCSRGPVTSGSRTLLPAPKAGASRVRPALRTGAFARRTGAQDRRSILAGTAHGPVPCCARFSPQGAAIKGQSIRMLGFAWLGCVVVVAGVVVAASLLALC
jgi:hypothetical protein